MNEGRDPLAHHANPILLDAVQREQMFVVTSIPDSIRTPQDESTVDEILKRNKDAKIESRSAVSRAFAKKFKRSNYNQREIFRALQSVVNGHEKVGPGVVEVLQDKFIAQGGDVNFAPKKKSFGSVLRKDHKERSGLLETAAKSGKVEVVEILSRHSDKISLDNSLEIALHNRDACTVNQGTMRGDQMIQILISHGADGSSTISAAVAVGDEVLLHMLLEGRPSKPALSEALPMSVIFRDIDARRRLIRMLLEKGADVNHNEGESMLQATQLFDMLSLDMLLERRPHVSSLSRAFASALNQTDSNNRFEACQKLISAGAAGEEVSRGLTTAITVENQNINFLKLILPNASVDYEHGHALCLAITNDCQAHVRLMLEKRPSETTFDAAFAAAVRLRNPRHQLKYCRILVEAGPVRDSCSKALVIAAKSQKEELCKVFLEKGASPDFDGGDSIKIAVLSENIGILELLVGGEYQKPVNESLAAAFEVALSVLSPQSKKLKLLRLILDAGLQGPTLDVALVNASKQGHEAIPLCKLFLEYGASVNAQGGEALDICTQSGDLELMKMLLQGPHLPSAEVLSIIFQSSQKLDPRIRYLATKLILESNMPINDQIAAALDSLVQDRRPDMQTIEVLLSFDASVHYKNHRPLVTAAEMFNKTLLKRLLAHSRDELAASLAFDAMMRKDSFWSNPDAFSILTILLENGAEGTSVNEALIKTVADNQPSARHFEVTLLQHRVDINYKAGEALQIATERGELSLIRRMLDLNPGTEAVSMAFPFAFFSKLGAISTLAVIDLFVELPAEELDPYFMHPVIPEPPIFLCLNLFPTNLKILESTWKARFYIDQMMSSESGRYTALY